MKTLIISDGKPGHSNQAKALCGIMGWQGRQAVVLYRFRAAKGATYALDRLGIYCEKPFLLLPAAPQGKPSKGEIDLSENYSLIVAVGSASYYPAKVIGKKIGAPVVAMMYPRGYSLNFAHIICPAYDKPPKRSNITALPLTLCGNEPVFYEKMTEDFGKEFAYSLPAVGVIIGGDNKYGQMNAAQIEKQLQRIFELTPNHSHWLTTSRRTSKEVEEVAEQMPFDYSLIYSKRQYNPVPAFLTLCDYLFVTSDSSSMISESVSVGKAKVEILKNAAKKTSKFDTFLDGLEKRGCIHIFDGTLGDAAEKIAVKNEVGKALSAVLKNIKGGEGKK